MEGNRMTNAADCFTFQANVVSKHKVMPVPASLL